VTSGTFGAPRPASARARVGGTGSVAPLPGSDPTAPAKQA
jgi:hypothetical protein